MSRINYTAQDIDSAIEESLKVKNKQDKLVSGTNIKTIGGQSILGSGNLPIESGTKWYLHMVRFTLYDTEGNVISEGEYGANFISTSSHRAAYEYYQGAIGFMAGFPGDILIGLTQVHTLGQSDPLQYATSPVSWLDSGVLEYKENFHNEFDNFGNYEYVDTVIDLSTGEEVVQ